MPTLTMVQAIRDAQEPEFELGEPEEAARSFGESA